MRLLLGFWAEGIVIIDYKIYFKIPFTDYYLARRLERITTFSEPKVSKLLLVERVFDDSCGGPEYYWEKRAQNSK